MGSKEDTAGKADVSQRATPTPPVRPFMLIVAAVALAAEALALLAVTVLDVVDLTTDQTYQVSNGLALIVLQLIMIAGLVALASGVLRLRPWTRTPAVMVQVLVAIVGIVLLQAGHPEAGVPALVLAVVGLAGLFTPASLKALAWHLPDRS